MSRLNYIKAVSFNSFSFRTISNSIRKRALNIPFYLSWKFSKKANANKEKLRKLKNKHKDKRCFILANGPSLKKTDLSLLRNEYIIAMNRMYINIKENINIDYLVVTDMETQLTQFTNDYNNISSIDRFYNWKANRKFKDDDHLYYLYSRYKVHFSKTLEEGIWGGHSVTFACLQLAYHLGFKQVILVGKDHNYSITDNKPGSLNIASGKENNHFSKDYFMPGMVWKTPDYKGEEYAYSLAKEAFESEDREIIDATIDGKLKIFKKVDYYKLFK